MLLNWDPFREFDRAAAASTLAGRAPAAPLDAYRHGDELVLELDLPGVDPATIDLTVEKRVLRVTASRAVERAEGDTLLVRERPTGRVSRTVRLGDHLDDAALAASYVNGVLRVTVPVREAAKPRRVPVTVGGTGAADDTQADVAA